MATDTVPSATRVDERSATRPVQGFPVLRWVLIQQRRSLLGWAIAMAAITAIYVSFWPAMGGGEELQALIDGLPEGLVSALGYDGLGSAAGYLESTVFGLLGPVLLLVFVIGAGARTVAGLEEEGALELESSAPVSRRRVLSERMLALGVGVVVLCLVAGVVSAGLVLALDMDVALSGIAATTLGLALLVSAHGAVSLGVGAATGRRSLALGAGAGLAVAGYMANAIGAMLDDGEWLRALSPFHWYLGSEPLVNGVAGGFLGLAALTVVAAGLGLWRYERRDLGV
jgi:ABC-2 type transport system permease protein